MCGDFLQLPPVLALGLYSNTFNANMEFAEHRAIDYVWRNTEYSINGPCEFVVSHRQKDLWLASVLQEHRRGEELWGTYSFVHGLLTRHAGSWMPSTTTTECRTKECEERATEIWEQRKAWTTRGEVECGACDTERQIRCRVVLPGNPNPAKHSGEPSTHAPYIHPSNAPKLLQ